MLTKEMQEPYVIDVRKLAGRQIVIDLPEESKRSYICCNTRDWSVNVDATNLPTEKEFLWNFEKGRKVIYTSLITRICSGVPAEMDFRLPLWNLSKSEITLNDKPYMPVGDFVHDYVARESKKIKLTKLTAEGAFTLPAVIFSNKISNGFAINIEVYLETGTGSYTIWEKTIKLEETDSLKKAKYKNRDYYVWDTQLEDAFDINTNLNYEVNVSDGVGLGISVRLVSTEEVFIGQKEDLDAFLFKLSNFHYILQFSDL